MFFKIQKNPKGDRVFLIDDIAQIKALDLSKEEIEFANKQYKSNQKWISFNRFEFQLYLVFFDQKETTDKQAETLRKQGAQLQKIINQQLSEEISVINCSSNKEAAFYFTEGLTLANYQFLKYKSDAKKLKNTLASIRYIKKYA